MIDFSQGIHNLRGQAWKIDENTLMTLGHVVAEALQRPNKENADPDMQKPAELVRRMTIASAAIKGETMHLKSEDITLVKTIVARIWSGIDPMIAGAAIEMLDGAEAERTVLKAV